jgi:HEAT repeat protein
LSDFQSTFQALEESLRSAAGNVMGKIDQMTFKWLVDNLKSTDYQVVADTLEQLENEKRPISIPPVYFLSVQHPDGRIRQRAALALSKIDVEGDALKLTAGKSPEEGVKALIERYGNFRAKR